MKNNVTGTSGIQRPATTQTYMDHVQASLKGSTEKTVHNNFKNKE